MSNNMGQTLLEIKGKTKNDYIRTCVSDLESPHRKCLRYAQRSCNTPEENNIQLVRSICDEQLLFTVESTLNNDDAKLTMAEVNDEYLSILRMYHVQVAEPSNYRWLLVV